MSKKVVITLSILAIVFACAAGGLWYTVQGTIEKSANSLGKLSEFISGPTYEAKLAAPAKAVAKLAEVRAESAAKSEDIAAKEAKITGLERAKKDLEGNVADLETKTSDLTREREELKTKAEGFQSEASKAQARVKELEESLVKQTEIAAKEKEELNAKINADKNGLLNDLDKARRDYTQIHNFATGKGLLLPLPVAPWNTAAGAKEAGPHFATNVFVAEVIGFDARQGLVVLNVGSEAGLPRNQGFNLMVGDTVVTKITISDILNGGVSTASISPGSATPKLAVGTAVKLVPLSVSAEEAPAAAK